MKLAILLCVFVLSCFATNDVYLGGEFLLTLQNEDGNLNHVSSLVAYEPDSDTYSDVFDGGVFLKAGLVDLLVETPLGIFGTGYFTYIGDDYDYSNSVLRYDLDDDEFETVHDGIFLRNGEAINYIAGTKDHTFFAGNFDSVEYIDEQSDSDESVFVPNIVKLNSDDEWSLLENPDNVFPDDPIISGLTAGENDVYIYASPISGLGTLYQWNTDSYFSVIAQVELTDSGIAMDSQGNIGAVTFTNQTPGGGGTYKFLFFSAADNFAYEESLMYTVADGQCVSFDSAPQFVAWSTGFLFAIPNLDDNCNGTTSWAQFTSESQEYFENSIPEVDDVDHLVVGDNADLWVASKSSSTILYLPFGASQWAEVDLSVFGDVTVRAMTFETSQDKLLVYTSVIAGEKLLFEIVPASFPPRVEPKTPGSLYIPGSINGLAVVNDPDDDDYELYIGGNFDGIGSKSLSNFVRYKDGEIQTPIPYLPHVTALAASADTVFYATADCAGNTEPLNIGYYNQNGELANYWIEVPTLVGGSGCVTTLSAYEDIVLVGGSFSVQLSDGDIAHGVVMYNQTENQWSSIGVPTTVSSSSSYYEINSLQVDELEGALFLAIGGFFDFTVSGMEYHSFALKKLSAPAAWQPTPVEFAPNTVVNDLIVDGIESVYIAGKIIQTNGNSEEGVFVYDQATNTYQGIGNLPAVAESIILFTDDDEITTIFAGGDFQNVTQHTGLAYSDVTAPSNQNWMRAASSNQYNQFYYGDVTELLYQTGGAGEDNQNGYESSYEVPETEDSGMGGWGKFFLTVFILLIVFGVIGGVALAGFAYYKKRNTYQALV